LPEQSLKTEANRNRPNPKDQRIIVENRPELTVRRGQAKYKTKDHGALAGLDYRVKRNGGTSTLRTEEHVDKFMDHVREVVEHPDSDWFEDGTYLGNTDRAVDSFNIYNEELRRVAVFKRSTGEFITLCEPDPEEAADLVETGNFLTEYGTIQGQARNVPPRVEARQDQDIVDDEAFSSDDEGFTSINTFESDVMGITPADSSSSDF